MLIGIDTGGTYTDAVRYDPEHGVLAKAKARTQLDLSVGISEVLAEVIDDPAEVEMVALSTTLATNALVEGIGGRVALVFIGFLEADLESGGLREGLGDAPVIIAAGGHDSLGGELAPLDIEAITQAIDNIGIDNIDAFAVSSQFSVRNPAHEEQAKAALLPLGKPVACGHELSAKLNGPKRALTCLLNARLIGLIAELCEAAESILAHHGIEAPLMLVRGDGSLVSADFAKDRPIETILSGPAASLIGAAHLTDGQDVVVSDIGGTTTDVGIMSGGVPRVSTEGAKVGGHQTMVEAVDMFTVGLGGDSEITIDTRKQQAMLTLGPRRLTPISLLAIDEPELVHNTLDGRSYPYREQDTRFVRATGRFGSTTDRQAKVLAAIGPGWIPVDRVANTGLEITALQTLVSRGLATIAGFTPSDAAHVVGLHSGWDGDAANKAAELLASTSTSGGTAVRPDGHTLSEWVIETLIRRSAEAVLTTILDHDGFPQNSIDSKLVQQALDGHHGVTEVRIGSALPVVGLGASAPTYYPNVAKLLGAEGVVPEHADVANALGAVAAKVRIIGQATVSQPSKGQFRVHIPGLDDFGDLEPALDAAVDRLKDRIRNQAAVAGADEIELQSSIETKSAMIAGKDVFVEATVTVIGTGQPRLARDSRLRTSSQHVG